MLAILSNTAASTGLGTGLSFLLSVYPEVSLLDSYMFLRILHSIFDSGFSSLHSHQWCAGAPLSLHCCQYLLSLVFLIIADYYYWFRCFSYCL